VVEEQQSTEHFKTDRQTNRGGWLLADLHRSKTKGRRRHNVPYSSFHALNLSQQPSQTVCPTAPHSTQVEHKFSRFTNRRYSLQSNTVSFCQFRLKINGWTVSFPSTTPSKYILTVHKTMNQYMKSSVQ
jgi:hypothetical protein